MKYIAYFTEDKYGYFEFEAKDRDAAEERIDRFLTYADLNKQLKTKTNGWQMIDLDEIKGGELK